MDRAKALLKLRSAKDDLLAEPGMYAKLGSLLDVPNTDWHRWAFLEECDSPRDIIEYFKIKLQSAANVTNNLARMNERLDNVESFTSSATSSVHTRSSKMSSDGGWPKAYTAARSMDSALLGLNDEPVSYECAYVESDVYPGLQ